VPTDHSEEFASEERSARLEVAAAAVQRCRQRLGHARLSALNQCERRGVAVRDVACAPRGRASRRKPRKKSLKKLQEKLRPLTKRTNGRSLSEIVAKANPILRGWYGYFRESHPTGLSGPDGWIRRRLRAMLRKREKRPGYGLSQADSRRWPNRWFAGQGLFSLEYGSCTYGSVSQRNH
jgi:hypothetical protein